MKNIERAYNRLRFITSKKPWMVISLLRYDEMTSSQIQRAINAPQSTVAYILSRLYEMGIVEKRNLIRVGQDRGRPFMVYSLSVKYIKILYEAMYMNYLGGKNNENKL
jgi:DNA-binding transcriptional ArsR family regulator